MCFFILKHLIFVHKQYIVKTLKSIKCKFFMLHDMLNQCEQFQQRQTLTQRCVDIDSFKNIFLRYCTQINIKINKICEFWLFNQHSSTRIIENAIELFELMFISIRILFSHKANLQNCLQINNNRTLFETFEQRQRALLFTFKNIWWKKNEIFFCFWKNEHRQNCKTIFSKEVNETINWNFCLMIIYVLICVNWIQILNTMLC
jgi:hypothetical protein